MVRGFGDIYRHRKVLITGHTGFKGSWLSSWLLELGADIIGYSLYVPSTPANFEVLNLQDRLVDIRGDLRDMENLRRVFAEYSPEIVFHLAAQPITRKSYDIPQETFLTNLGGTVNVLECIRNSPSVKATVLITSDKCYQNKEWIWGYRENDRLGGDDPYSASKACAEIACHSYMKSFFSQPGSPLLSTSRAGNVIGGGDWATDRIMADTVRAFSQGKTLKIRSARATRPWQHVLEPLSGYLWLGANLLLENHLVAKESFNFGPSSEENRTVEQLIQEFMKTWGHGKWQTITQDDSKKESTLLKLNCDKALHLLSWRSVLAFEETVKATAEWYKAFYNSEKDMYGLSMRQIRDYIKLAEERGSIWPR